MTTIVVISYTKSQLMGSGVVVVCTIGMVSTVAKPTYLAVTQISVLWYFLLMHGSYTVKERNME